MALGTFQQISISEAPGGVVDSRLEYWVPGSIGGVNVEW